MMATSEHNQPVESTFEEYLDEDDGMANSFGTASSSSRVSSHSAEPVPSLAERLLNLEEMGTTTQLEMQKMKREMRNNESKSKEKLESAEARQEEANSYARTMAMERDHIARERTVTEEQLQLVLVALKIADTERDRFETAYQEKLAELRRTYNAHNNTLRVWEEEMTQLRAENLELKRENGFLRETFFAVNPQQDDHMQLKCFSCKHGYSTESRRVGDTHTTWDDCAFHPLPPVKPSVWHRWQHGALGRYRQSEYAGYFYWSCCNVLAVKDRRPDGCRSGPHHQRWEMDVMMRRVMLSKDILDEEDEEQDPRIVGRAN